MGTSNTEVDHNSESKNESQHIASNMYEIVYSINWSAQDFLFF